MDAESTKLASPRRAHPSRVLGRDGELARLESSLRQVPVALIYGIAGVGKSTLVAALADRWPGPVAWVAVRPDATISSLTAEAMRLLKVPRYDVLEDDEERVARLCELLDQHQGLVVLDDLHLLPELSRDLLVATAGSCLEHGRLIATSRELIPMTPTQVDRAHLHLEPLGRDAARQLCASLSELFGPRDFEQIWEDSRGNPFLLRQAHIGTLRREHLLDELAVGLTGLPRRMALALAQSQVPIPQEVLSALARPGEDPAAAWTTLQTRLVAERDFERSFVMHDLIREHLLRSAQAAEQHAVRQELLRALEAGPMDVVHQVRETARHLRALGRHAELAELLGKRGSELVMKGAEALLLQELEALPPNVQSSGLRVLRARTQCNDLQIRRAYEGLAPMVQASSSCEVRLTLGNVANWGGELAHAEALLGPIADDPEAPQILRTRAALGRAWTRVNRGDWTGEDYHQLAADAPLHAQTLRLSAYLIAERIHEGTALAMTLLGELHAQAQNQWSRRLIPALVSLVLSRSGHLEEARLVIQRINEHSDDAHHLLESRLASAVLDHELGARHDAAARMRAALRLLDGGGFFAGSAWTRSMLARVHFQLGQRRTALALLEENKEHCQRAGSTAFAAGMESARGEDPLHPTWLTAARPAARPDSAASLRDQVRHALALAREGRLLSDERLAAALPNTADFALDRALLALARAVHQRRLGHQRVAQQLLRQATALADEGRADLDVIPALYEQLTGTSGLEDEGAPVRPPHEVLIDLHRSEIRAGQHRVSLSSRPVLRSLLLAFAQAPGQTLSYDEIAAALWQSTYSPDRHQSTIKSNIRRLRTLVGAAGLEIIAEATGYRLTAPGAMKLLAEP